MIVVDASAMVEMLLQTELGSRVEGRLLAAGEEMHAPHLLDLFLERVGGGTEIGE